MERDDERDRLLLSSLANGQPEALAEVYDRHGRSLFEHALALSRNRADAEDLVHIVFVKLATTGAELLGVRHPAGYFHRMLSLSWVDVQRGRAVRPEQPVERSTIERFAAADAGLVEAVDMDRALDTLPPTQRQVIVLRVVHGFSLREVGHITGVSVFTVASRYRLGMARLRRLLGDGR